MSMITSSHLLCRMEAAHRQTRGNLDRIERQISARAERMTMTAKARRDHTRVADRVGPGQTKPCSEPISTRSTSNGVAKSMR